MNAETSPVTTRASGPNRRISNQRKTWFIATGNNFGRMNEHEPMPGSFMKVDDTRNTTVRISGMIDEAFTPIVNIVEGAATRPERIDARCTTIGETYKPTAEHIETSPLAQWDTIANCHVDRCSPRP